MRTLLYKFMLNISMILANDKTDVLKKRVMDVFMKILKSMYVILA